MPFESSLPRRSPSSAAHAPRRLRDLARRWTGAVLAVALLLGTGGPVFATEADGLVDGDNKPGLFLLYTGDVIGYLGTCGCKRNPSGGLPRRQWVLGQLEQKFPDVPRLLVDSGNFSDNPTLAGDVKTKALIEAMGNMGYAAVNVGERDLRTGYDDLMSRIGQPAFPLLSTNIVNEDTGEPVFAPSHMVQLDRPYGKTVKVGIVGAARYNPVFLKAGPNDGNLIIERPIERLKPEVAKLKEAGAQMIVLLAALHMEEAKRISKEIQDIDFVVGAYAGQVTAHGEQEGRTWILYSGNQGKRIGETRVFFDQYGYVDRQNTTMHFLTRRYPADQGMLDWVNTVEIPEEEVPTVGGAR